MVDDYSKSRKTLRRETTACIEQLDDVLLSRRQREEALAELSAEADQSSASALTSRFPAIRTEH